MRAAAAEAHTVHPVPCMHHGLAAWAFALIVATLVPACRDLPRDPAGTAVRVEHGTIRVGVAHAPPHAIVASAASSPAADADVSGTEVELVRALASELDARIVWSTGGEQQMLERLAHRELDVVVAGLTDDDPRAGRVALTAPYAREHGRRGEDCADDCTKERKYVLALPPGENRWLMRVERFLAGHRHGSSAT